MDIMDNKLSNLYIISAPSGTGKTSLVRELCKKINFLSPSISYTTRKIRKSEIDGRDYFFVDDTRFREMVENSEFIEYQNVYDNFYGSSKKYVLEKLRKNKDVILEIDYKGMMRVKSLFPDAITIYIVPPDIKSLKDRLMKRGQDDYSTVERRIMSAKFELSYAKFADYVIVNDSFTRALIELIIIVLSYKLKKSLVISKNSNDID